MPDDEKEQGQTPHADKLIEATQQAVQESPTQHDPGQDEAAAQLETNMEQLIEDYKRAGQEVLKDVDLSQERFAPLDNLNQLEASSPSLPPARADVEDLTVAAREYARHSQQNELDLMARNEIESGGQETEQGKQKKPPTQEKEQAKERNDYER